MAILTPTLSVIDLGLNPGQVSYSITGGSTGATNVLFRGSWSNGVGAVSFASFDTQTGNVSNVAKLCPAGFYWWYVQSTLGAETTVSNLFYMPILSVGSLALVTRLQDSIVATLKALNLSTIGTGVFKVPNINELTVANNKGIVFKDPLQPPIELGSASSYDKIQYAIQVCFTAVDSLGVNSPQDVYDSWLERITRTFRNQRIANVPESTVCRVEPVFVAAENRPAFYDQVAVGICLKCECREPRGFGA